MSRGSRCKKRPCRICRRWFLPNARLKDRQMTCGDYGCKREWHRKKCQEWNRANRDYFRATYLQKKLEAAQCDKSARAPTRAPPGGLSKSGLPFQFVQEVIGVQHVLIIEYLAQLLIRRFQEVLRGQLIVNTGQTEQLPAMGFSIGDRL
jgi:hypothetical protein